MLQTEEVTWLTSQPKQLCELYTLCCFPRNYMLILMLHCLSSLTLTQAARKRYVCISSFWTFFAVETWRTASGGWTRKKVLSSSHPNTKKHWHIAGASRKAIARKWPTRRWHGLWETMARQGRSRKSRRSWPTSLVERWWEGGSLIGSIILTEAMGPWARKILRPPGWIPAEEMDASFSLLPVPPSLPLNGLYRQMFLVRIPFFSIWES